jgi:ribonuclease Z
MRPTLYPRLVNGPFDDPGLMVDFLFEKRAFLFDAGDISSLTSRELLRVTHLFVSHTHMDHFIGFDRLLRLFLGRNKVLYLFGPEGFLDCVQGKLAGYTWNLVSGDRGEFTLHACEVRLEGLRFRSYSSRDRFLPSAPIRKERFDGDLLREPALTVATAILDHGDIPSLCFSLTERFHINIAKAGLEKLGLPVGPWLGEFKAALYEGRPDDWPITIGGGEARTFRLADLAPRISRITPGQKIAYVVDAAWTPANIHAVTELIRNSDHVFIEAAFSGNDRNMAARKHHLTAVQAGQLAARAGAKRLTVFHFSPRYADRPALLATEAHESFESDRRHF